ENLPSLAPLMLKADLAIGAAGTTSWERCCLGLPTIIITVAENQQAIAKALDKNRLACWAGDKGIVTITGLASAMKRLLEPGALDGMSRRCLDLTDGAGAQYLADLLMLRSNTPLQTRPTRLEDETLLLEWAND